jgi:hypothetical protein
MPESPISVPLEKNIPDVSISLRTRVYLNDKELPHCNPRYAVMFTIAKVLAAPTHEITPS